MTIHIINIFINDVISWFNINYILIKIWSGQKIIGKRILTPSAEVTLRDTPSKQMRLKYRPTVCIMFDYNKILFDP